MYILLFALWVIFNGKITVEIAIFGAVISALIFWFLCKFMDYSVKKEIHAYKNIGRGIAYIVVLVIEIFKANGAVMRLIVSPKYEVEPKLMKFKTDIKSETSKVVLANSITLTPGTITVSYDEDEYLIHCLDKDFSEGIEDSCFVQRLKNMESKGEKK